MDWALANDPRLPVALPTVAAAALKGAEPKFDSRPLDGPSMIHSTEARRARLEDWVVWNGAPVVLSVSLRVNAPEDVPVTSPVNESPGRTATLTVTRPRGVRGRPPTRAGRRGEERDRKQRPRHDHPSWSLSPPPSVAFSVRHAHPESTVEWPIGQPGNMSGRGLATRASAWERSSPDQ